MYIKYAGQWVVVQVFDGWRLHDVQVGKITADGKLLNPVEAPWWEPDYVIREANGNPYHGHFEAMKWAATNAGVTLAAITKVRDGVCGYTLYQLSEMGGCYHGAALN